MITTKVYFSLLIFIFLLTSCNSTGSENQSESIIESNDTTSYEIIDVPFAGYWINKKYVDKLLRTQSPRASQNAVSESAINIPATTEKDAMIIWGFHEGSGSILRLENRQYGLYEADKKTSSIEFRDGEIILNKKSYFIKLNDQSGDNKILEELLFSGKYLLDDSDVEFTASGEVKGIDTIKYYFPLIDYNDAGSQVDQVMLGETEKDIKPYGFRFSKNKLTIYQLNCLEYDSTNNMCGVVENGNEILTLKINK